MTSAAEELNLPRATPAVYQDSEDAILRTKSIAEDVVSHSIGEITDVKDSVISNSPDEAEAAGPAVGVTSILRDVEEPTSGSEDSDDDNEFESAGDDSDSDSASPLADEDINIEEDLIKSGLQPRGPRDGPNGAIRGVRNQLGRPKRSGTGDKPEGD